MKNDEGFILISVLIALGIFSLLVLAIGQEINLMGKVGRSSALKAKALVDAVNTMKALKQEEKPVSGSEEKEGFIIESKVKEFSFSSQIYEIKVTVEDKNGKEILSLQTLREK